MSLRGASVANLPHSSIPAKSAAATVGDRVIRLRIHGTSGLFFAGNSIRHGINAVKDRLGCFRVRDFQAVVLVEGHDELQGIDRIEAEAAGAEEGLVITDFLDGNL